MARWLWMVVVCLPVTAFAQGLNGTAEFTAGTSDSASNGHDMSSRTLEQNVGLGWASSLVDPRLLRYNTEVLLRRRSLSADGLDQPSLRGRQHDLGYRIGSSLFPSGSFPVTFEASRLRAQTTGEIGAGAPSATAGFLPSSLLPTAFESESQQLMLNSKLMLPGLPLAEVGYRTIDTRVIGGPYRSSQTNTDLSASLTKDTTHLRQAFRAQHTAFQTVEPQAFSHRLDTLDYEISALLGSHFRLTGHGGQRTTWSHTPAAPPVDEASTTPYTPLPDDGRANARYASVGLSFEPSSRAAVRLIGLMDQQSTSVATTDATLATLSTHVEAVRGLSFDASGTSGTRGQFLDGEVIRVMTRSGTLGLGYHAGPRWLEGGVGAVAGMGLNTTPTGERGGTNSWSGDVSLSSTLGWVGLGAGFDRVSSRDRILDLGNYESQRTRASIQLQARRVLLTLSGDDLRVARGSIGPRSDDHQRTFSGSASYRLRRGLAATASTGGFRNRYQRPGASGLDSTLFWTGGLQATARRSLQISSWVRGELAAARSTGLDQSGLTGFFRAEYRLRTLLFGLEYRQNQLGMQYRQADVADRFRGRQLRFSIVRRFDFSPVPR